MSKKTIENNNDWVRDLTGKEPPPKTREEQEELQREIKSNKVKVFMIKFAIIVILIGIIFGSIYIEYQTRIKVNETITRITEVTSIEKNAVLATTKQRIKTRMISKLAKETKSLRRELLELRNNLLDIEYKKRGNSEASEVLIEITEIQFKLKQQIEENRRRVHGAK